MLQLGRDVEVAVCHRAGELEREFLTRPVPFSEESLQIWTSLNEAFKEFEYSVYQRSVTFMLLWRLKCAIQKAERYLSRQIPA